MSGVVVMNTVRIGQSAIGAAHPCFVIAEIGINHNGNPDTVEALIRAAAVSGAQAVKFQKRTVGIVYTKAELDVSRSHPWGTTNRELKEHLELGIAVYRRIAELCNELGLVWFASPWDEGSVDFLEECGVLCHKVASASLTDVGLLKRLTQTDKPIILSTGMSTLEEIDRAVTVLGTDRLILLHCVALYPTKPEQINLRVIDTLRMRYPKVPIGYSGHEQDLAPSIAAVACGACVVERHFTLSRKMFGSDQSASLEPHDFAEMVRLIRVVESALGSGEKVVLAEEELVKKKLRRVL